MVLRSYKTHKSLVTLNCDLGDLDINSSRGKILTNRNPNKLGERVVVLSRNHTGTITGLTNRVCTVVFDQGGIAENFPMIDVWKLKWKERRPDGNFLYKAMAWKSLRQRNILRVQKHLLYNGIIGRRIIILERVNGVTVREA